MSHASYRFVSASELRQISRSQRRGIPRFLQQERVVKTITRILTAMNAKSTTVALARVCRALERPVLDALWESQDDCFQLLKCFPCDVWEDRDDVFVSYHFFLIAHHVPVLKPLAILMLAFPPQPDSSRVGSFQEICLEDDSCERHAAAEIHLDPVLPNPEHGS